MEPRLTYRGRVITPSDLATIRALLTTPGISRRALSLQLCDVWQWRQPNGTPCDAICRGLLLWLHRGDHIQLPSPQWTTRKAWRPRTSAVPVLIDTTPIEQPLAALGPLIVHQVRRTPDEALFNSLLAQYHYLGYQQPVGEHLKYLVVAGDRPVACFAWGSAPGALGLRDRFIGWTATARRRNLRFLAANTRFLILPWVQVPHLASHLLGRMASILSTEWPRVYHHPIYWLETFIDPARFRGTCYRAANWIVLGRTTGRGHRAPTKQPTRPIKEVLGYPLVPDFRTRLTEG
ncbi:MAG: Druantia anti-phage system protein DruA [Candidatus Limnocylindria bacterium]